MNLFNTAALLKMRKQNPKELALKKLADRLFNGAGEVLVRMDRYLLNDHPVIELTGDGRLITVRFYEPVFPDDDLDQSEHQEDEATISGELEPIDIMFFQPGSDCRSVAIEMHHHLAFVNDEILRRQGANSKC